MAKSLRVGVLTGGGDCPGLNAVLRAVVKSLIAGHNADVVGFEDGFTGLIEHRHRDLTFADVSGILTQGGTILGTSNRSNPFAYHRRGGADCSSEVVRYATRTLGLDALVVIGGEGTLTIASGLNERGLPVVGIPKTIDNDIPGTDRCFGFDTAVTVATEALDRLHTTAQSHHRVMILETMGRYAGWIALFAGVAGGADILLIPEVPYDIDEVARVCREREMDGQRFTLVCMAEGAHAIGGEMAVRETVEDAPDPVRLGGVSYRLAHDLGERLRSEVRTTVLGHVQRGGTPTPFDRNLATALGAYAAASVARREFGCMVAVRDNRLTTVPLADIAGHTRTVPLGLPMVSAALAVGTSFGVREMSAPFATTDAPDQAMM